MDKNRQYRTINENNRVTDTFFTLLLEQTGLQTLS